MSPSFWVSLVVCVAALLEAIIDHRETLQAFRSSSGKERRWNGFKLCVYWIVFGLAFVSTVVTGIESSTNEKTSRDQAAAITNATKQISTLTANFNTATSELAQTESLLTKIKAIHQQRGFTKAQREVILLKLRDMPKGEVGLVVAQNATDETLAYREEFASIFSEAGGFILFFGEGEFFPRAPKGVRFWISPTPPLPEHRQISKAFKEAHVDVLTETDQHTKRGQVEIFIGNKEIEVAK